MDKEITENLVFLKEFITKTKHILNERLISVILFGSLVRSEDTDESDIDLLVVVKDLKTRSEIIELLNDAAYEILLNHRKLISILPAKPEELAQETPLMLNVKKEGIKLL